MLKLSPRLQTRPGQSRTSQGALVLIMCAALCLCSVSIATAAEASAPQTGVVQNVRIEPVGGGIVRILYDLYAADPSAVLVISVDGSVDGGKTFTVKAKSVLGDVGAAVRPGIGKSILWDAGKDTGSTRTDLIRARVTVGEAGPSVAAAPEKPAAPSAAVVPPPPPPAAAAPAAPPAAPSAATVVVTSDPSGAAVTVDGKSRGMTPCEFSSPPGIYKVVLAKSGYLDNSVTVDLGPGQREDVAVTLTPLPTTAVPQPAAKAAAPAKGKSSTLKWVLIGGGVAGAGVVAAVALKGSDKPPTPGTVGISPTGTGLAGATSFTFTSSGASDPGGKSLTYSWDFGDGGSGSGQSANHTYAAKGAFTAKVTVSNGKSSATATSGTVTVGDVTSTTWQGNIYTTTCSGSSWLTWTLTQSGGTIAGSHYDPTNGTRTITGSVSNPRNMTITLSSGVVYSGTLNSDLTQFSGNVTGYAGGAGQFCVWK